MAYTKQTWADLPSKTTPINAERLTHIEDGIFNAAQTADTAASTAGTAAANVGIVAGRVETLTERVNGLDTAVSNKVDKVTGKGLSTNDYDDTDKGKVDSLGTASTKNSTSVVTSSSDLVESGAVKDIVGWGNKNKLDTSTVTVNIITFIQASNGYVTASPNNSDPRDWNYTSSQYKTSLKAGTYKLIVDVKTATSHATSWIKLFDSSNTELFMETTYLQSTGIHVHEFTISNDTDLGLLAKMYDSEARFMIIKASIIDYLYEFYHPSVDEQKCDNSVIGTVEDGATASQAYAVGEHFIKDGQFKEVTQPIASGGAINDSNTVDKPIADLLTVKKIDGTTSLLSGVTVDSNRNNVYRYGKLVFLDVKITVDSDLTIVGATSLLQLPINALAITTLTCFNASAPFAYENEFALYTNPLSASNILYINSTILKAGSYIISGFFFEK